MWRWLRGGKGASLGESCRDVLAPQVIAMKRKLSSTHQAVLRRHLARVLQSKTFRAEIQAFRRKWRMKRLPDNRYAFAQSSLDNHRDELEVAADQFGEYWFRGLGGWWLSDRLILDANWESKPVSVVVEEFTSLIEKRHASIGTIRHDPGGNPFQPAILWTDKELENDLRISLDGHVVPSVGRDHVLLGRTFIEIFPWTHEEDVRRAFRFGQQGTPKLLPHKAQQNRDFSEGLALYQRYCNGDDLTDLIRTFTTRSKGDPLRDLRRYLNQVATLTGLPKPRRPGGPKQEILGGNSGASRQEEAQRSSKTIRRRASKPD